MDQYEHTDSKNTGTAMPPCRHGPHYWNMETTNTAIHDSDYTENQTTNQNTHNLVIRFEEINLKWSTWDVIFPKVDHKPICICSIFHPLNISPHTFPPSAYISASQPFLIYQISPSNFKNKLKSSGISSYIK